MDMGVFHVSRFRSLEDAMFKDSRYFATVRRATFTPVSESRAASLLSLKGFRGVSAVTSFLISALIAVDDAIPPACVET
jgi:hypothetical protein